MRYLILSEPNQAFTPETAQHIISSVKEWADRYTQKGKIETSFGYAGKRGGGCILNVASHEELTSIMTEFPPAPYSHVQIIPLVDLNVTIKENLRVIKEVMDTMAVPS